MPTHRTKESRSLLEIFAEFSPKVLSNGQIRMMCPFRDNHPDGSGQMSFFINPSINAYHCFSCGAKGNLIRLLTTQLEGERILERKIVNPICFCCLS